MIISSNTIKNYTFYRKRERYLKHLCCNMFCINSILFASKSFHRKSSSEINFSIDFTLDLIRKYQELLDDNSEILKDGFINEESKVLVIIYKRIQVTKSYHQAINKCDIVLNNLV